MSDNDNRVGGKALALASAGLSSDTTRKGRPVVFPHDVLKALEIITKPASLTHESSHADMIRNEVLREIRGKIASCDGRRTY